MLLFLLTLALPLHVTAIFKRQDECSGFLDVYYHDTYRGNAQCVTGIVPVAANSADNIVLDLNEPVDEMGLTQFFVDLVSAGASTTSKPPTKRSVGGVYNISSTLCIPKHSLESKQDEIQILTHGLGVSKNYWNFALNYSYADVAAAKGYRTLFYDRLGVGHSEGQYDPIQDLQAPLELAVLGSLVSMLRSGKIGSKSYSKIIGVGHSYGSILTASLTSAFPQALDAAVLTGFSLNSTGVKTFLSALDFQIARTQPSERFQNLPSNGYIVTQGSSSNQFGFFKFPTFTPEILRKATIEKGTIAIGEFLTQDLTLPKQATAFKGPVTVVNGDSDLPFCDGNCTYPQDLLQELRAIYPGAAKFATHIVPNTGHAVNFHLTANEAFTFIQDFVENSGI